MPRLKLTDAAVARAELPEGSPEQILWDTEVSGFALRLRPGSKSYIVAYRPTGVGRSANMKKLKVGNIDAFKTATEARAAARALLGRVAAGGDPALDRAEAKRAAKSRLRDALDAYEQDLERRGYVNRKVVLSGLRTKLKAHLDKDVKALSGRDFVEIMERLERDGFGGAADDFRSRARAFLTYCTVRARLLDTNPLAGYRKERATRADRIAKKTHGRALSDEELARVWLAADAETTFGRLVRFLILTGCRRGEGAGLVWAMIDRDAQPPLIDLPAAFTKQGRGHIVPITGELNAILDRCPRMAGSELVFPSPRSGGPFRGWTQLMAKLTKDAGVDFDLHDLRRTFRTGLSRLGFDTDLAELALGHAREDLEARYNRDDARDQLSLATSKWSLHVSRITST